MYSSIIISHGIVSDITVTFSRRTQKDTLRVVLDFPHAHYSNSTDYFYTYDLSILDRFSIGQKVYIYAVRHIQKGSFLRFMTPDPVIFKDYVIKQTLDRYIKHFNFESISDIYNDDTGLDPIG